METHSQEETLPLTAEMWKNGTVQDRVRELIEDIQCATCGEFPSNYNNPIYEWEARNMGEQPNYHKWDEGCSGYRVYISHHAPREEGE